MTNCTCTVRLVTVTHVTLMLRMMTDVAVYLQHLAKNALW